MSMKLRAALIGLTLVLFAVVVSGQNPVSVFQWGTTTVVTGSGTATGALRVEVANNGTGLITAAQATAANLNATVVGNGTFAVQAAQSGTWTVLGGKTNNNAAPGATNFGVLSALANAAAPAWTEGNQVAESVDLHGSIRATILDASGLAITPSTLVTQDTALTVATTTGGMQFGRSSAAAPASVSADDKGVMAWYLRNGSQVIQMAYAGVLALTGTGAVGTGSPRVAVGADTATIAGSAPGTAGAASANVVTVQGVGSMTPILATVTNAGTFPVQNAPTASTTGGATPSLYISAASNNSTNLKASAGTMYSAIVINATATLKFIRFYDSASAPTCTSATGAVFYSPIPANSTTGAGFVIPMPVGANFANGIGWCITGAAGTTDNTSTAVGDVVLNVTYK